MKSKRRRHEPAFKAKVAMEAIKGARTIQEIAKEYEILPVQISEWKKTLLAGAGAAFGAGRVLPLEEEREREKAQLHSKIGELTVHVDFLKKKCKQLGLSTD